VLVSDTEAPQPGELEKLKGAVRDLWAMMLDSGQDFVVFMDHRRLRTRVERRPDDLYYVSWEEHEDGPWIDYYRAFEDPREAAFHGFQGPH